VHSFFRRFLSTHSRFIRGNNGSLGSLSILGIQSFHPPYLFFKFLNDRFSSSLKRAAIKKFQVILDYSVIHLQGPDFICPIGATWASKKRSAEAS